MGFWQQYRYWRQRMTFIERWIINREKGRPQMRKIIKTIIVKKDKFHWHQPNGYRQKFYFRHINGRYQCPFCGMR
jgi:hypothetical protein